MHPNWSRDTSAEIARRLHLGQAVLPPGTWRADANDPFFFARDLDKLLTQTYDKLSPPDMIRSLVRIDSVETGLRTISWRGYEKSGIGSMKGNHAKDMPLVDASAAEAQAPMRINWLGCQYSMEELAASARAGGPSLDAVKMAACAEGLEKTFALQLRFGSTLSNTTGLLNNANVLTETLPTGDWLNAGTSDAEILADMSFLLNEVRRESNQVHAATRVLMGPVAWERINRPIIGVDSVGVTLLQVMRAQFPGVTFECYFALDTSSGATDVDAKGNRLGLNGIDQMVAYQDTGLVAPWSAVAREASPEAPQQELADFTVMWLQEVHPGVVIPYPRGMRYVTNHIA